MPITLQAEIIYDEKSEMLPEFKYFIDFQFEKIRA